MKNRISFVVILILMLTLCACQASENTDNKLETEETRKIQDCYGFEIDVPLELTSISTNYQSATQIMLMLGGEDIISGSSPKYIEREWVKLMYPEFCQNVEVPYDNNGEFNVEELLIQSPQLFLSYNESDTELTRNAGVLTANIGLYDYPGIEQSVLKIGELMGTEYYENALKWQTYYQNNVEIVQERVKDIPENERIKILFLRGNFEKTYGKGSVISSWISLAGGVNVLDVLDSRESIVQPSAEEILKSNPDYIIIGDTSNYTEAYNTIISDERFVNMDVISNNKILFNPYGMHQWEKYYGEAALQILWAAKTFYPEKFEDIDLIKEVKFFYKEFHGYELTDEQAEYMLNGLNPDGSRT